MPSDTARAKKEAQSGEDGGRMWGNKELIKFNLRTNPPRGWISCPSLKLRFFFLHVLKHFWKFWDKPLLLFRQVQITVVFFLITLHTILDLYLNTRILQTLSVKASVPLLKVTLYLLICCFVEVVISWRESQAGLIHLESRKTFFNLQFTLLSNTDKQAFVFIPAVPVCKLSGC